MSLSLTLLLAALPSAVLYDGTLGTTPDQQGWLYICCSAPPFCPCSSTQTAAGGVTVLDSTASGGDHAGYFASYPDPPFGTRHPNLPVLDRQSGFTVRWDVKLESEAHVRPERAGFSVIVISEDFKGAELGFWTDQVWIQNDNPVFTHGEGASFDTTAKVVRYELCVAGDRYTLLADGTALFGGLLRDYYAADMCNCCPKPAPCPYHWPSHVFMGDDTTSARAKIDLAYSDVTTGGGGGTPSVGNTLTLVRAATTIALAITPAVPGSEHVLYRDPSAATQGTTLRDRTPGTTFAADVDSLADPSPFYFVATARGACGQEFP